MTADLITAWDVADDANLSENPRGHLVYIDCPGGNVKVRGTDRADAIRRAEKWATDRAVAITWLDGCGP